MDGLDVAWQWLVNNGNGLAALAAVDTAAIAIIALRSTAADSRDRSRPYVLAELSLATDSDTSIDIVIRGTRAARGTPARSGGRGTHHVLADVTAGQWRFQPVRRSFVTHSTHGVVGPAWV